MEEKTGCDIDMLIQDIESGLSLGACAKRQGVVKNTISYHLEKLGYKYNNQEKEWKKEKTMKNEVGKEEETVKFILKEDRENISERISQLKNLHSELETRILLLETKYKEIEKNFEKIIVPQSDGFSLEILKELEKLKLPENQPSKKQPLGLRIEASTYDKLQQFFERTPIPRGEILSALIEYSLRNLKESNISCNN